MRALVSLSLVLCAGAARAADINIVEEIICKVNGDIITRSDVERARKQLEAELRQQGLTGAALQKGVADREPGFLRDRIDNLLLVQKGKELSINVDGELSKRMAEIQKQSTIADPDKFQQYVRDQSGMPFEDFRSEMRNSMLTERVIRQEVGGKINVPKPEIEKYYQEHKSEFMREERVFLRAIVLNIEGKDEKTRAAIEKKAKDLVARARKGEKFDVLARENSDAPSAPEGGDLGGFKRGQMDQAIEALVFDKERGYVTDAIQRPDQWLILKVEEKHVAGQASLEEVESEVMNALYGQRMQPRIREFLTQLRKDAFLEIKPGYVDINAAPGKDTAWKDPAQLKPETITKEEVASQPHRRRLLWAVPLPGTQTSSSSSSSRTAKMK